MRLIAVTETGPLASNSRRFSMRLRLIVVLGAVLALNAQDQPTSQGVNFYSIEKEVALGKQLVADFRQTHAPLDNPAARDYIDQMGVRLEQALPQPSPFTYHFELTTDFSRTFLEPAAFPGGFVIVPAGLILAANDEAELAGTLAHAMAHIAARHGTRQATRGQIAQQATIPLIFWGGWNGYGWNGYGPSQDSPVLLPVGMLISQKAYESEADRLAVSMTAAAGYDPEGLARYVGRVQDPPQRSSSVFSAFPPREKRVRSIEQAIQALPATSYYASGDFARIQEEVRRALPPPPTRPKPTLQR
jgi:beta-barrel assembly-enhancing protease